MRLLYLILCMLCVQFSTQSAAQGIKVKAVTEGIPLEYANLFINDRYYGYSESDGVVNIKRGDISPGDSIAVTYVGMERGVVVYDPKNYPADGIIVSLVSNLNIGGAVVVGNDQSLRLFERYVRNRYIARWFYEYNGKYKIRPLYGDEVAGNFLLVDYRGALNRSHEDAVLVTRAENADVSPTTRRLILSVLGTAMEAVSSVGSEYLRIKYQGVDDKRHVFTLTRPLIGDEYGFQTIIYSARRNKELESAKVTLVFPNGLLMDFSATYDLYNEKHVKDHVLYPTSVEGSVSNDSGKIYFSIEDVESLGRVVGAPAPWNLVGRRRFAR